jgi:hypothetical protein
MSSLSQDKGADLIVHADTPSPLDNLETCFRLLTTAPAPLALNGTHLGHGLPARLIPLGEHGCFSSTRQQPAISNALSSKSWLTWPPSSAASGSWASPACSYPGCAGLLLRSPRLTAGPPTTWKPICRGWCATRSGSRPARLNSSPWTFSSSPIPAAGPSRGRWAPGSASSMNNPASPRTARHLQDVASSSEFAELSRPVNALRQLSALALRDPARGHHRAVGREVRGHSRSLSTGALRARVHETLQLLDAPTGRSAGLRGRPAPAWHADVAATGRSGSRAVLHRGTFNASDLDVP